MQCCVQKKTDLENMYDISKLNEYFNIYPYLKRYYVLYQQSLPLSSLLNNIAWEYKEFRKSNKKNKNLANDLTFLWKEREINTNFTVLIPRLIFISC